MGKILKPQPLKLIIGFIFQDEDKFNKALGFLEKYFGKIDFSSQTLPFVHTNYYEKEFGRNLKRRFISFKHLISPEDLSRTKIITNKIEKRLSTGTSRTINIDPGYLSLSKLILVSTKDHKHRIYLNQGIYAEVTLFYQDKTFKPWEWSYPDYKTEEYIAIFNQIREVYAEQIKGR